ncbi:HAD family hydrolase, partial [bacterium]
MNNQYTRPATLALLHEFTRTDSLRRHAYAVEAAMKSAAVRTGNDEVYWSAGGLLHDFD